MAADRLGALVKALQLRNTRYRGLTRCLKLCFGVVEEQWRRYDLTRLSADMDPGGSNLVSLVGNWSQLEELESLVGYYSDDLRSLPSYETVNGKFVPSKTTPEVPDGRPPLHRTNEKYLRRALECPKEFMAVMLTEATDEEKADPLFTDVETWFPADPGSGPYVPPVLPWENHRRQARGPYRPRKAKAAATRGSKP